MRNKKRVILNLVLLFGLVSLVVYMYAQKSALWAEQTGSSPESGATSRLKTTYDAIVAMGQGSDSAGSWGDWGAYWNRIRSAEVDYSQQSLVKRDDYYDGDETGEESTWTNTAINVWKDSRTGLYWSNELVTSYSNLFTIASCDFFTTTPRGSYVGGDSDCGDAINACATLSLEAVTGGGARTDWYLPSYKELQQASIDGMYNQAGSTFTTDNSPWSSTECTGDEGYAFRVNLFLGDTLGDNEGGSSDVRCVRRD